MSLDDPVMRIVRIEVSAPEDIAEALRDEVTEYIEEMYGEDVSVTNQIL